MQKKKILLIAYYWPPSGGPGVQRWLKMAHYLAEMGCDITVLTVSESDAHYPHQDEELLGEVHSSIKVIRTKSFNPYRIFGSKKASKQPAANFSVPKTGRLRFQFLAFVRSHLFIPDPRRGWNYWAKKRALALCKLEGIETVITTSPPHSTQLIGLYLKRKLGIKWVVDFRDPWTQIFYYHTLNHSAFSRFLDARYERLVVANADKIIHVGETMVEMLVDMHPSAKSKSVVVHNGYDERDFDGLKQPPRSEGFHIAYTGTLSSSYDYQPLFRAIRLAAERNNAITCTLSGQIPVDIESELRDLCPIVEFTGELPHSQVTQRQLEADLLLLVLSNVPNAAYILSGKVFEYLRTGNQILCLGPTGGDADKVIQSCEAGRTFERDQETAIADWIVALADEKLNGNRKASIGVEVKKYSREQLAAKVFQLL